ncbi:MAG: hypothetical protein B6I20_05550 [Bacteroidetes bacterium 4572_117]|nr:MAG: hypothetical protein B6I20_05550 [Bacteroidetes bacterium 4572_117]
MLLGGLNCKITIGGFVFNQVNELSIERTSRLISDTATIKLPLSAVFENKKKENLENKIKRGNKVTVELAYNDAYNVEFTGYVKSVSAKDKTVIECEDNAFLLRKSIKNKSFKDKTLKNVIEYIAGECKIELNADIPDIKFDSFLLKNIDGLKAIQKLKDNYGLTVFFDYEGKLYVGLAYVYNTGNIAYDISGDIKKSNLTFKKAEDIRYKVKAISLLKNNKKLEVEIGDADGEQRTLYFRGITDENKLKECAAEEMKKYKYTGYQGTLITFGTPLARFGMSATITDGSYPAREGDYYIESVKTDSGQSGFQRTIELGIKL